MQRPSGPLLVVFAVLLLLGGAYGVALVGVILSARHAGFVEGAPHAAAARRLIPWAATWVLMIGIIMAGYVALIFPGI